MQDLLFRAHQLYLQIPWNNPPAALQGSAAHRLGATDIEIYETLDL
jgi:hypothetical protein